MLQTGVELPSFRGLPIAVFQFVCTTYLNMSPTASANGETRSTSAVLRFSRIPVCFCREIDAIFLNTDSEKIG